MKRRILVLFIFLFTASIWMTSAQAASGTFSFLHSLDFFPYDNVAASNLASYANGAGYYTMVIQRPSNVYGINSYFQNTKNVYISTHGEYSGGKLILTQLGAEYNSNNVVSSLSNPLIYLSACYAAKTNSTSGNLCSKLVNSGVGCVISYSDEVDLYTSRYFEDVFFEKTLEDGYSILASFGMAISNTVSLFGQTTTTSSCEIFGNPNRYID